MKTDRERYSVDTWMGALCSLTMIIIVLAFTIQKINVFVEKRDIDIYATDLDNFYDASYVFDSH